MPSTNWTGWESGAPRWHLSPRPPPFRHRQPRQLRRQAKKHGLLFLALTDESGNLAWISSARRSAASEITAGRHDRLADRLRTAGLGALADLGFHRPGPRPKTGSSPPDTRPPRPASSPRVTLTRPCPPPALEPVCLSQCRAELSANLSDTPCRVLILSDRGARIRTDG
jgi:hypothetical protein